MNVLDLLPDQPVKIDLLAPPFAGHLHPILAIGKEISARHHVRVISTPRAMSKVTLAGLEGVSLLTHDEDQLFSVTNPRHSVGSNPIRLHRQFKQVVGLLGQFKSELEDHYRTSFAPDLLIADFTLPVCGPVAEQFNCLWWTSLPSPCVLETPDGPPAYCGGLKPARNLSERLQHHIARNKVRIFKKLMFSLYRSELYDVGLRHLYRKDGSEAAYSSECVLALGDQAFEFPRTWPKSVRFVGPKLYTPPSSDIAQPHFQPGKKHVLVTLGTHLHWHKDSVARTTREIAERHPDLVFHFSDGDANSSTAEQGRNFSRLTYIDYERYTRCYDAVVHHGGAGIMYYCIQNNKPVIVYPLDYDQFDHAARIECSGRGIWIRDLRELESALCSLLKGIVWVGRVV